MVSILMFSLYSMKLTEYISGLIRAGLGETSEGFTATPSSVVNSVQTLYSSIPILLILHLTAMAVYGMGAARLSYCYQLSLNPAASASILFYIYIALAFSFSPIYYPFYAIVLHTCKR